MKKIILTILLFLLLGGINQSFAKTSYTATSGIKECEGQTRDDNSGQKYIPVNNDDSANESGDFECELHGYWDGEWSDWKSKNTIYNCPDNRYASKIEWRNSDTEFKVYCKKIDDTAPNTSDVTNNNPTNLLANNSKSYYIGISENGGSPIDYIKYQLENYNSTNSFLSETTDYNSLWGTSSWNISKIDNDREGNGARKYTFQLKEICDKAGNCWTGTEDYIHNVYANLGTFAFSGTMIENFDGTDNNIADGTAYPLTAILEDSYGNAIIPATGINRTIDFNFDTTNNLNKDQYNNTGNAVYLTTPNDNNYTNKISTGSNIITNFNFQNSNNGNYTFNWKIYAPTNQTNDSDNHDFIINSVKIDINQSDSNSPSNPDITNKNNINLGNSNINFNFKPLYITEFSGTQTNSGFIEGVTQTGGILTIEKENNISTSNRGIYLIKSGSASGSFIGTGVIDDTSENINGPKAKSIKKIKFNNFYSFDQNTNPQTPKFTTLFTLDPNSDTIKDIKDLYVNSWISYKIYINGNNEEILYAGDKVGGDKGQLNTGLKIYGLTNISDKKIRDITEQQENTAIHNLDGKITKSILKNEIRSNAYKIIKNIKIDSSNSNGEEILIGNNYIYYNFSNGNEGSNKELKLDNGDLDTNKTIIVYGGNLYLKCDGTNTCKTDGNHFPGIIVMKDKNGNGGNLYINPNVTKIDAAIYVDKSILSYNEISGEISPNNGGTYEVLKNQLYIHGSVFSENTIGGSRKSPAVCPFYKYTDSTFNCTLDEAQKYDLNYLRRGIDNAYDSSLGNYPVIIKYNSKLQTNPPALFHK